MLFFVKMDNNVIYVKLFSCEAYHLHFHMRFGKADVCTQLSYHSQRSFWHKHTCTNLHRTLHLFNFIEFQCTYGLLVCDGEMVVTSELKFRQFFTIPLTVKVWPFLTRRCTREKCHVTVIFGSFSNLNFGKVPEINKKPEIKEACSGHRLKKNSPSGRNWKHGRARGAPC
jgi:hypothetical protein